MNAAIRKQNERIGRLMKEFVAHTVDFYNDLETRPVCSLAPQKTLHALQTQTIPAQGRPVEEVYAEMLQDVYAHTALLQHPRSFSCIPSTASMLSWMGDVMTNAYNPHASCRLNAPAAHAIEQNLIRWMCGLAGYPKESGGLFVSGGSIANLTALTAARDSRLTAKERSRAVVYVSDQTHSSVAKGLLIIGFLPEQIRKIPTDRLFRMDISALKAAIRQDLADGKKPFAVVASAGTTNTGSVDPLPQISGICRSHQMWMHVDGAFGASALVSERCRKDLAGIELSDSLSWDAHKWLLQTYGCSVVLVRNQETLSHSFLSHPEYLKDSESFEGSVEFWDLGPELTRPARSLKLWMTLQTLGSRQVARGIEHGCALAEKAEQRLMKNPEWEIISPAHFGIINFRYNPGEGLSESELDRINLEISREITQSGFAQIFTTELLGKKVLRICAIHPETTIADIDRTIELLEHSHVLQQARLNRRAAG